MKDVTITLNGEGLRDTHELNIQISISSTINIDPKTARHQVTAWLVSEVGNMLIGGAPQLVVSHKTVWRVPVSLTSSTVGTVDEVGAIDLDAESGELLVNDELKGQILDNVKRLIRPTPTPVS